MRGATALVALAVATVSDRFDPNADTAADVWLERIRILHADGYFRPHPVPRRDTAWPSPMTCKKH